MVSQRDSNIAFGLELQCLSTERASLKRDLRLKD